MGGFGEIKGRSYRKVAASTDAGAESPRHFIHTRAKVPISPKLIRALAFYRPLLWNNLPLVLSPPQTWSARRKWRQEASDRAQSGLLLLLPLQWTVTRASMLCLAILIFCGPLPAWHAR